MKKKSKARLILNIGLIAAIIIVIIFIVNNALSEIFEELKSTSIFILLGIVLLGVLYLFFEGRSVRLITRSFIHGFSGLDGFFAPCYIAFYRVITMGTGTAISEVQYYRNKGMKTYQGVGASILHMVVYKLAIITYAVVALIFQFTTFYDQSPSWIITILIGLAVNALIVAVLILLSSSIYLQMALAVICNRLFKSKKIRDFVDQLNLQIYSLRDTIKASLEDRSALLRIYGWNILKMGFWYLIPYLVLSQSYPDLDFIQTFAYICFATVLAGVIPTPAGMGSMEFVYVLLFKRLVGTVDAASSVLLYRFGTYVLPFLIGMVYVIVTKNRQIKEDISEVRKEKVIDE